MNTDTSWANSPIHQMIQNLESSTPETNALIATDQHHLEDDQFMPASTYWRMCDLARKLERERDEWQLNALLNLSVKQLSCMWCGEIVHAPTGYKPGTPLNKEQRVQAHQQHVATCQKHPIRDVERERDEWKAKYIQQNKDLGCEMMDPNGTIWDYAKKLDRERDEAREQLDAERALADRLAKELEELLYYDLDVNLGRLKSSKKALDTWKEARSES